MESGREIIVRLTGGRRVEAELNGHHVLTDQPQSNGGEDTAPSPFQVFLASLGTCAGIFVQGFCAKRGIPYKDIRLIERPTYGSTGALESVEFELQLPPDFPAGAAASHRSMLGEAGDRITADVHVPRIPDPGR